ncbi:Lrp/AsnC family transcriptional regulator [Plantactinospora solaniradicis]|uniref:Lrp/AsnC family transcriptional regulator n=1 Tax=Plantactinospora solaniradicis TaxID=1723736 RepID=A0ABW1KT90_9ACTN
MPKVTLALDDVDHELLDLLQRDSGRTLRELGDLVALSPSAVKRRIDRCHKHGVIARQVTMLDPNRLPTVLLAVCLVTLERESRQHQRSPQRPPLHHAVRTRSHTHQRRPTHTHPTNLNRR